MILTCVTTMLLNISGLPYNSQDFKTLARTQEVCQSRYEGCLKQFQKREKGVYRVLCGEREEFDKKALDKHELDGILEELKELPIADIKKKLKTIGIETE